MSVKVLTPASSEDLLESIEDGISDAYAGDEALTTGVTTAGVQLASQVSDAVGTFFQSISATLSGNPKIVTYVIYAATAYSGYALYRRYVGGNS